MRKLFFISSMLLSCMMAKADLLYVKPFVAEAGVSDWGDGFSVCLENSEDYVGLQFDLYLPEGMELEDFDNFDPNYDRLDYTVDRKGNKTVVANIEVTNKGDHYLVTLDHGTSDSKINGTNGEFLYFYYKTPESFNRGVHDIQVKNVVLAIDGYHDVKPADATSHVYAAPFDLSFREGYGTFVAPFDVTLPEGVKAFADGEVIENVYKLGEPMSTIPANTPVFVKGESASQVHFDKSPEIKFVLASATHGSMIGAVVAPVEVPVNSFVLQKHEGDEDVKLYRVSEENPISLTIDKCCLCLPESFNAPAVLGFWNEETGITQIVSDGPSSTMTYDLMGRSAQSGLLIEKNKKYIVK